MRAVALALGFAFLFLFQLGDLSLVDYDEGAYAEVAREMVVRDDLLRPFLDGEPWYEKPPALYWSMVAGTRLFGMTPLGIRLFNALAAVALILVVYAFARRPLGERAALLSAIALGCSIELIALARVALTDLQLTLWLTITLGCLHRALEADRSQGATGWGRAGLGWFLLACLASGAAMLTKGLIGFLLPGGAVFLVCLYERRLRRLFRPVWLVAGLPVLFGVGLSWYFAIGAADGWGFMRELFWEHHVGRFLSPKQSHGGPIVYYVPVLLLGFLPWSVFLPLAVKRGELDSADDERGRFLRLLATFALLVFVFFSLAATKLPNYVAPTLPALALLIGDLFARQQGQSTVASLGPDVVSADRGWTWSVRLAAACYALVGVTLAVAPHVLPFVSRFMRDKDVQRMPGLLYPVSFGPWSIVAALLLVGCAAGAVWARRRGRPRLVFGALAGGTAGLLLLAAGVVLPRYDAHFRQPQIELARRAAELAPEGKRVVLVGIRHAPSVVFYGGRLTRYVSRKGEQEIAALFAGPEPEVGLTTVGYVERLRGPGKLEVIAERLGYVLFRCSPASASGTSSSTSAAEAAPDRRP